MIQKFVDVMRYFKEKYWYYILRGDYPNEVGAAIVFGLFFLTFTVTWVNANQIGATPASVLFTLFGVPIISLWLGAPCLALLWIVPALPIAIVAAIVYGVWEFAKKRIIPYDFLTNEELTNGYIDFSIIGGDLPGDSGRDSQMG